MQRTGDSLSLAGIPCHSLLCGSLSWTLSQADHIIFLNTLSHYRAHFLSVNISNLIWHQNSNFSFSLNRPFPLQPGEFRRKHLRQKHRRPIHGKTKDPEVTPGNVADGTWEASSLGPFSWCLPRGAAVSAAATAPASRLPTQTQRASLCVSGTPLCSVPDHREAWTCSTTTDNTESTPFQTDFKVRSDSRGHGQLLQAFSLK